MKMPHNPTKIVGLDLNQITSGKNENIPQFKIVGGIISKSKQLVKEMKMHPNPRLLVGLNPSPDN